MNTEDFTKRYNEIPYSPYVPKPRLKVNPTAEEAREYAAKLEEYESGKATREMARIEHQNKRNVIEQEFRQALFEDLGIQDNPKRDKLYALAWEKGHSCGFNEVYLEACELTDLITEEKEIE